MTCALSLGLDFGPSRLSFKKNVNMASKKDSEVEKSEDLIQEVNVGELVKAEDPAILAVMNVVLLFLKANLCVYFNFTI